MIRRITVALMLSACSGPSGPTVQPAEPPTPVSDPKELRSETLDELVIDQRLVIAVARSKDAQITHRGTRSERSVIEIEPIAEIRGSLRVGRISRYTDNDVILDPGKTYLVVVEDSPTEEGPSHALRDWAEVAPDDIEEVKRRTLEELDERLHRRRALWDERAAMLLPERAARGWDIEWKLLAETALLPGIRLYIGWVRYPRTMLLDLENDREIEGDFSEEMWKGWIEHYRPRCGSNQPTADLVRFLVTVEHAPYPLRDPRMTWVRQDDLPPAAFDLAKAATPGTVFAKLSFERTTPVTRSLGDGRAVAGSETRVHELFAAVTSRCRITTLLTNVRYSTKRTCQAKGGC